MSQRPIHQCQCEICQSPQPHADKDDHHRMNVSESARNEQHGRRWNRRIGHGGSTRLMFSRGHGCGWRPALEKKTKIQ